MGDMKEEEARVELSIWPQQMSSPGVVMLGAGAR